MINLKCKKCGWRMPLMRRTPVEGLLLVNIDLYNLVCPRCGHVMIQIRNGFKEYSYRQRNRHKHKKEKIVGVIGSG